MYGEDGADEVSAGVLACWGREVERSRGTWEDTFVLIREMICVISGQYLNYISRKLYSFRSHINQLC